MKKLIQILAILFLLLSALSACNKKEETQETNKIKIVTTIFPTYDWVRQIIGEDNERFELILLADSGVDLHSYQPTTDDIIAISTCDLFIYVGGTSDQWVEDVLRDAMNKDMGVINLIETLGAAVKEEEIIEGMQHEDNHGHGEYEEEHQHDWDEHVWLSLTNAQTLVSYISKEIIALDSELLERYQENTDNYLTQLQSLDETYRQMVLEYTNPTILVADRFPFRYLVDDYHINYYAAYAGCTAETEASFETVIFLANKVDELELSTVLVIDGSKQALASTVIENTHQKNQNILTLNSMQAITAKEIGEGITYLAIMQENLTVLAEVLK